MIRKIKDILDRIVEWWLVPMSYGGFVDYPNIGKIYDMDVYRLIKDHSRWIDRRMSARMVEMSLMGQCILMGIFKNIDPDDRSWKFYGKHSVDNIKDWG